MDAKSTPTYIVSKFDDGKKATSETINQDRQRKQMLDNNALAKTSKRTVSEDYDSRWQTRRDQVRRLLEKSPQLQMTCEPEGHVRKKRVWLHAVTVPRFRTVLVSGRGKESL